MDRPRIGLVVPSIYEGGGVPAVARFIKKSVVQSAEFSLSVFSLATSAQDDCSIRLAHPMTWSARPRCRKGIWEDVEYTHVGARFSELEFQRYRPRETLAGFLADCDLVQVVGGAPAWALSAGGVGKPVVLQVATRVIVERRRRERVERGPKAWWRWGMTRIIDQMDNAGLRAADAVLVENPWMLGFASEQAAYYGTWVRYAPPGIDCSFFTPHAPREAPARPYVLAVGRFDDPRKNPGMLLEAFGTLCRSMPDAPALHLAGAGDPGPAFWERAATLGVRDKVTFHMRPSREALARLYRDACCFALSSDEEGFGIVIVEAMASGVPVVATACGGPEGIISEGVDGFLVEIGDAAGMAERIARLARDWALNARMGQAARQTAVTQYSEEVTGEMYLDTYRRLLARRAARS